MDFNNLKSFLDEKVEQYNCPDFIENDPIQIPHRFDLQQDIEISGFFSAIIAWGNRKSIINSANKIIEMMGNSPYDFVMNYSDKYLDKFGDKSVHRTFMMDDFKFFLKSLNNIYSKWGSLEDLFLLKDGETNFYHALERFRRQFLLGEQHRSSKHISSTYKKSAAKRLMMYLRWFVRKDKKGVDFGLWKRIDQRNLSIPLDVHTANISRKLGLLHRPQNDWKAVEELDDSLRRMDEKDPAKYDFALFGIGVTKELD